MTSVFENMTDFGDDEIFYGSVAAHLRPVAGTSIRFDESFQADTERDAQGRAARTISRVNPIPHADGPPIIVPCMPCLDFVSPAPCADVSEWPAQLQQPLIKTHESNPNEPKAFASGCRSACVKVQDKWYRLKGSGNNADGFIVKEEIKKGPDGDTKNRQIRGCAFTHSAVRENYMAADLESKLDAEGIPGANGAMGYYLYSDQAHLPLGEEEHNLTACIVQTTRGDRRFGTHVMTGLQLLLPSLVEQDALQGLEAQLEGLLPPTRHEWSEGPIGLVQVNDEDCDIRIQEVNDLFGDLQRRCAAMLLLRASTGEEYHAAWAVFETMMEGAGATKGGTGGAGTATAAATTADDGTIRRLCTHLEQAKLVTGDLDQEISDCIRGGPEKVFGTKNAAGLIGGFRLETVKNWSSER
jgi:hypothetical protein